jgi:putative Ca2+/H+ antiporter (TMEM165/GDT1 family)
VRSVTPSTALTTFGVIFLAELPDKSLFASLVLGTRFHPVGVWIGVAGAFAVHVVIAVAAGGALSLLPGWIVDGITALLFLIGAIVLLLPRRDGNGDDPDGEVAGDDPDGEVAAAAGAAPATFRRAVMTSFGIVFVGEWGDLTQITTANLAARYHDPFSVGLGALLGLWAVAALAIGAGRGLMRVIPLTLVRRIAGLVFLTLAVLTVVDAVRA